ncbi:DUF1236 domain-containing protein [Bradyrhizobium sp. BRP23]|uniref:DUF1236 domain-containing protein n=1 Tax=Bradyrhizobium sp. BRP23 TaxID=2793820 RepID=UPI001CD2A264|nr:DUF1236 domain-containing protein [Bradyrhizobium sp. BRP23]MCA1382162.1 DUF1236 domain-containing protein [Bradyrhizobium sp. BRP05]MCA1417727.1 DUF1236 domain-containing protein [Bradyrhizobium sp. BRP23]
MIRLLATTALGVVLASAAYAQSPSTNPPSQQTPQSQSNSTAPSTSSPSSATDKQQTTSQPQQSPPSGTSAQTTQANPPSSGSGTANTGSTAQSQSGTANSNAAGNQPATQQSANPPAANTNQAQDRSNPPPASNQAQQAPAASGTNQAQQAPSAPTSNQAAAQTDVNLNKQQETKISASISHLNVRPLTNVNFALNVGTVVPRDVHLSTLPPDVVEIVPQYRGYSFALVKDQIVVVDPATYKIVTVLPYSGQSTATTTTTRERSASKFSDRDREVIRKHAKTRTEGRKEVRTTGSTARSEIRVGDRLPESVEVEEFPTTVYRDAPGLREYRYIHRDTRTYVIEPRERRVIEEID